MAIETVSCAQNPRRGFGLKWPADNNFPARNPKALVPEAHLSKHNARSVARDPACAAEVRVVLSGGDQFVTKLFALIGSEDRHAGILMDRLHGGAKIPTSPKTGEKCGAIAFLQSVGSRWFGNICSCLLLWTTYAGLR